MPTHDDESHDLTQPPTHGLVFTKSQMRRVDAYAIEELGIPGILLMEHAALALRHAAGRLVPRSRPVVILAGPGNNGGDGFALARLLHLDTPRRAVECVLLAGNDSSGDAAINLQVLRRLAKQATGSLRLVEHLPEAPNEPGLIVDAMFGSGLTRALSGRFAEAVEWVAARRAEGWSVLAVDVPSGMDADSGQPVGSEDGTASPTIRADETVTLGGMKTGLRQPHSAEWAGKVTVGDIGVPRWVLERFGERIESNDQG